MYGVIHLTTSTLMFQVDFSWVYEESMNINLYGLKYIFYNKGFIYREIYSHISYNIVIFSFQFLNVDVVLCKQHTFQTIHI